LSWLKQQVAKVTSVA